MNSADPAATAGMPSTASRPAPPGEGRKPAPALTLVATGLGLFMVFLDATIVNVALPAIQSDFDAGESGVQWVVAAYSLTMGMFMMTSASLSDSYGRRRAYVIGIALFAVASVASGHEGLLLGLALSRRKSSGPELVWDSSLKSLSVR